MEARLVGETGEVYGRMDGLSIVGAGHWGHGGGGRLPFA